MACLREWSALWSLDRLGRYHDDRFGRHRDDRFQDHDDDCRKESDAQTVATYQTPPCPNAASRSHMNTEKKGEKIQRFEPEPPSSSSLTTRFTINGTNNLAPLMT